MAVEELLNSIDDENKKKAVLTYQKDGKYLIIAGPGTGKTYTVSKRIEAILNDEEKGTSADRILCLTFSDAAAREMRLGLEKNHVADAEGINIYTFHSFCMNLMELYSNVFKIENKSLITPIQKQAIVKRCIDELEGTDKEIKYLRTEDSLYANIDDIVKGIEAIKHNRLTPEKIKKNLQENVMWKPLLKDYDDLIESLKNNPADDTDDKIKDAQNKKEEHEKTIYKVEKDLLNIYEKYKEKTKYFIDYDDMINLVLEEFEKNPLFLENVASNYDFVLVDEYQDTNKSQNDIVFALASRCKNIFVVGDDDQIIYAFQGANLDTIKNFVKKLDNVETIPLEQNRRSTKTILRVAEELAKLQDKYPRFYVDKGNYKGKNGERISKDEKEEFAKTNFSFRYKSKELNAFKTELEPKNKPVIINQFNDNSQECTYIVNKIRQIIEDKDENPCPCENGEKLLSEIAVLTKTNSEAYNYANRLKELGIKVQLAGGKDIFEINSIKVLIAYLQFMANPEENKSELYKYLLYKPFHINPHDYKILHSKDVKNLGGNNIIRRMEQAIQISQNEQAKSEKQDKGKILVNEEKLKSFINTYHELENYITCESVKNAIIQIAHKTGIYKCYMGIEINRTENIGAINRLLEEAESFVNSKKGMAALEDAENGELSNFKGFVSYLNTLISGGIRIFTEKTDKPNNAVQVCTLHSSKGREFEYVFMPNVTYSKFENNKRDNCEEIVPLENTEIKILDDRLNNIEQITDKKRQIRFLNNAKLIYVGMTRAKHYLSMSFPKYKGNGPSWFIDKLLKFEQEREAINPNAIKYIANEQNQIDKLLKDEIRDKNYDKEINNAIEKIKELKKHLHIDAEYEEEFNANFETIEKIKKVLEVSVAPDEATMLDYDYASEFNDYIIDNIPKRHSVSSINTYLDCPKKYLYQNILHLVPEEKTDEEDEMIKETHFAQWGLIIHYALENYVRDAKEKKQKLPFEVMEKYFDEKQTELLENASESTISTKKENLKNYFKILNNTSPDMFFEVEKGIDVKINDDENDEGFHFVGKIDRIDICGKDDSGKPEYVIYDYKTGKNKSKVKDKTQIGGEKESIYNQLAFYKYVLETKYGMTIKDVGIIFPEEPESSFLVESLSGKDGLKNCEKVIKNYLEVLNNLKNIEKTEDTETQKLFECKPKCPKGGEYCYCDFKDFCSSNVL